MICYAWRLVRVDTGGCLTNRAFTEEGDWYMHARNIEYIDYSGYILSNIPLLIEEAAVVGYYPTD